ncbi:hypothetical protein JCM8097_005306 [Rhodosporidiobolus ruineniae]
MLLTLPPELIERIVRLALPSYVNSWSYVEYQTTLCHLCHVCSVFRQVAQPILEEVIYLDHAWDWERISLNTSIRFENVRLLWPIPVDFVRGQQTSWSTLAPLVRQCSFVQDLRLVGIESLNMQDLESLGTLSNLVLDTVSLSSTQSYILQPVRSLEWLDVTSPSGQPATLQCSSYPALEALACTRPEDCEPALFKHLDCVFWISRYSPAQELAAVSNPARVLRTVEWDLLDHTAFSSVHPLRVEQYHRRPEAERIDRLSAYLSEATSIPCLPLLMFPHPFDPSDPGNVDLRPELRKAMVNFQTACAAHGIEVVYDPDDTFFPRNINFAFRRRMYGRCAPGHGYVSPLFWARAKKLKKMEDADGSAQ